VVAVKLAHLVKQIKRYKIEGERKGKGAGLIGRKKTKNRRNKGGKREMVGFTGGKKGISITSY